MKKSVLLALLLGLAACASPDSPAKLAAAGQALTPTREGTMPTTATQERMPNGQAGWAVTCETGRNFLPCESRASSLCPGGYTVVSRGTKGSSSTGIKVQTATTGQGETVTGFTSLAGPPVRTLAVICK